MDWCWTQIDRYVIFYTGFAFKKLFGTEANKELLIIFLNFCFDDSDPEYFHHEVMLMDTKTKEVFYDKLSYIYLEMPKFVKQEHELETLFDKWLFAIRHLPDLMERPKVLYEMVFQRFFEQAEIAKFNRKERLEYEDSLKAYRNWYSVMETAKIKSHIEGHAAGHAAGHAEGLAEGRTKGIAEGRAEEKIINAKGFKDAGVPIPTIAIVTGLSIEEIEKL